MITELNQMSRDVHFDVRFTHRLRFTEDILGQDSEVLWEVLQTTGSAPARVQLWLDQDVSDANEGLAERFELLLKSRPDQATLCGVTQTIPGGEACKNSPRIVESMLDAMNQAELDRRSYVIVAGGGAVLDAVGYAAAIAHRGIRLVRLPTTTLGQADSGVGVKNAINRFNKKNWVGTFAVPWAVINDASLLCSLPDRDFRCGFAEAVKVFLLKSEAWFDRVCENATLIGDRDLRASMPVIVKSAQFHLDHITQGGDPFESREARPLDFGHWSAHKLEPMTSYAVRHGEAVSIGVAADVMYSSMVHGLPSSDAERALRCLLDLRLPITHPTLTEDPKNVFDGLEEFRQHLGGRLTVTMLEGVGEPVDVHEVDQSAMYRAFQQVAEFAADVRAASLIGRASV